MTRRAVPASLLLTLTGVLAAEAPPPAPPTAAAAEYFEKSVRPVLAEQC